MEMVVSCLLCSVVWAQRAGGWQLPDRTGLQTLWLEPAPFPGSPGSCLGTKGFAICLRASYTQPAWHSQLQGMGKAFNCPVVALTLWLPVMPTLILSPGPDIWQQEPEAGGHHPAAGHPHPAAVLLPLLGPLHQHREDPPAHPTGPRGLQVRDEIQPFWIRHLPWSVEIKALWSLSAMLFGLALALLYH